MAQFDLLEKPQDADTAVLSADGKSPSAFKTISEAADMLGVPQHVLRFWESRFSQIRPLRLKGGRRYYRPEDMEVLLAVKHMLYKQGFTIKGAKKAFEQQRRAQSGTEEALPTGPRAAKPVQPLTAEKKRQLTLLRRELTDLRDILRRELA
jgi:DNA-binding transcriptional MerR regulator